MAAHQAPMTLHLHLHQVHASHRVSWLAVVIAVAAVALVVLVGAISGQGTLLSPDQLPQPRNLTTIGR